MVIVLLMVFLVAALALVAVLLWLMRKVLVSMVGATMVLQRLAKALDEQQAMLDQAREAMELQQAVIREFQRAD